MMGECAIYTQAGVVITRFIRGHLLAGSAKQNLGAWEDLPQRVGSEDITQLSVDASDAFVLTRVDGRTTVAELCTLTSLGERKTLEALERLVASGLVSLLKGAGKRTQIELTRKKTRAPQKEKEKFEPFFGVPVELARWLNAQGELGFIPGQRTRGKDAMRFGGMSFDQARLKELDWMTVERKKEILFLDAHRAKIDHFEFLGMEPTQDKKVIRKAFFEFSRRFHPDTVFRRDVGSYRAPIEAVFKYGTQVYEWLNGDENARIRYTEALKARDAAIRKSRLDARADKDEQERADMKRGRSDRRARLQERLDKNAKRRKTLTRDRALKLRNKKAQEFFEEGKKRLESEAFAAAYNAFRLATQYDPANEVYQNLLEQAGSKMKLVKAEQVWKRGYLQESLGNFAEAMESYLEACEIWPRHEYCSHIAELLLRFDENLHKAEDLARKAVQAAPKNISYRMLLGRIYERAKLASKARAEFEKILELEPKHTEARRAIKAL